MHILRKKVEAQMWLWGSLQTQIMAKAKQVMALGPTAYGAVHEAGKHLV
jgi:hypothetical protein